MPYVPPSYEALRTSTSTLIRAFNRVSERYEPPPYDQLYQQILTMGDTYKQRVAEKPAPLLGKKPEPNPKYTEIIERIIYLARHMDQSVAAGSAEQIQQHNVLLGALFYQYLSIDASYKETYTGRFFSYMNWIDVDTTALYSTLKSMLNISKKNQLDKLSIVTRCSAYLEELRKRARGEDLALYVPQGEDDFFQQLQSKIANAEDLSEPMERQIRCLKVVQSFDAILSTTSKSVSTGLKSFCDLLSKTLKTKKELSREEMVAILSKIELSPLTSEIINYLLQDGETLTSEKAPAFLENMLGRLATYNQFTLLGMYVIMLEKSSVEFPLVTETLNIAIGITPANAMDTDTRILALSPLLHYLQKLFATPHDLDCRLWRTPEGLLGVVECEVALLVTPVEVVAMAVPS